MPPGPTGKTRADGARERFLRGATAVQELIEPMITGKPYPIKGLFAYGINLLHTVPNVARTKEALKNLDLVVAIDVLPQDHIAWADVVLPEATYLERYDEVFACGHKTPFITMREPAVEPPPGVKPGWLIAKELGSRIGLEKYFAFETIEEYLDERLQSAGLSLAKMRKEGGVIVQKGKPWLSDFESEGKSPFTTPSEKIELYAESLEKAGHDAMPKYEPTAAPPAGYYRLLYGRSPVHTFARTQNTPLLHELFPENEVWLNIDEAVRLGLKSGDYVMVESNDGLRSGPVKVKATQRMRKDAVYMVHGFGHDAPGLSRANRRGASDAALMSKYALDPISGGAGMRITFVRLSKAEKEA